jgi:hypothetical protein
MFPYFAPFLSQSRKDTFLEYMLEKDISQENAFFSLGTGKLRQPKSLYLRFCENCWREDIQNWGEPYWHRLHQLPGVFMCHRHGEPLRSSPVLIAQANLNFYTASVDMIEKSDVCGSFRGNTAEKLMLLSQNSQWLLENGHKLESYEQIYPYYDLWLRSTGCASMNGSVRHNKIYEMVNDMYGEEFLKMVEAHDKDETSTWEKRILFCPSKLQHPMYHIILQIFLAGSVEAFLNGDCKKPQPYGENPWPCRNPICPHNLEDVIEKIDIRCEHGWYRALFQCPHCGFTYRRKQPVSKEKQYTGPVYIASYGHLWQQKLYEYMVNQGLSARRTCELLQCDMYTVQKYAVQLGYMKPEDATSYVKKHVPKLPQDEKPVLSEREELAMWRQSWEQLVADNPGANRSLLITLAPSCYIWLRKNDLAWFEKHSPATQSAAHFDWEARDEECLRKAQEAVETLRNTNGRPIWITVPRIARQAGLNSIAKKKSIGQMPKTSAYLSVVVESIVEWRKRKIVWAIRVLRTNEQVITLFKIGVTACIDSRFAFELYDFMQECLDQEKSL